MDENPVKFSIYLPEALHHMLGGAGAGLAAAYATDDRLYAYEAAGILLGQDDLPQAEQESALARLITPLVIQVRPCLIALPWRGLSGGKRVVSPV